MRLLPNALSMVWGGVAAVFLVFMALPAAAQGPYYELVETFIEPNNEAGWTVSDGHISNDGGTYSAEYSWSPPPRTSDSAGFDVTLNIEGKAKPNRIYAGTGISSPGGGFTFDKDPAGADVSVPDAAPGGSESRSNSVSVHVTPSPYYGEGSTIELRIGAYYKYGVIYRYRVSDTPISGGGDDGMRLHEGPLMVTVDCPTDIVIGQLPSLNCHLLISGFRRNTADPVEVVVPEMLDQFGNHANGIQVVDLDGAQDVFNWGSTYSWGFFVYACRAPNIGANCYDNVATPGPATIPVVVQQKGLKPVRFMLTFNVIAKGGQIGERGPEVRIGNRWIASTFINIESGAPSGTTILLDWLSARWTLDPVENGRYVRIHSVWKEDEYLHIENGALESGSIQPEWTSAMWEVEQRNGYVRFRNAWQPENYLHMESGYLESGPIGDDWLSADWWLLQ
ncbi:MAG TPA: hypothetical protein VIN06_04420 [Devosia sp.]